MLTGGRTCQTVHCNRIMGISLFSNQSKDITYENERGSMSEGFSTRLPYDSHSVLEHSLAVKLTHVEYILITDPDADSVLTCDVEKLFQLIVYDDSPI